MSSKIDLRDIVRDHFSSLKSNQGCFSIQDGIVFFGIPLFLSAIFLASGKALGEPIVSMLVNFGSIFTALLLSVLMLVYEQQNKLEDRQREQGKNGSVPFYKSKI